MQEADAVRAPGFHDFSNGPLLLVVERAAQGFGQGVATFEAEPLGSEGFYPSFRAEGGKGGIAEARQGSQLPLRHRRNGSQQFDGRGFRQPELRQVQAHHVQLSRRAPKALQHFAKALGRQEHRPWAQVGLRAGLVGTCQPLFHDYCACLHQHLEMLQDGASSRRLAFHDGLQRQRLVVAQQVVDGQAACVELSHEIGVAAYEHFALHLEPRGQGGLHDLACSAHIVIGQPFPKPKLLGRQDGLGIHNVKDGLHALGFGRRIVV